VGEIFGEIVGEISGEIVGEIFGAMVGEMAGVFAKGDEPAGSDGKGHSQVNKATSNPNPPKTMDEILLQASVSVFVAARMPSTTAVIISRVPMMPMIIRSVLKGFSAAALVVCCCPCPLVAIEMSPFKFYSLYDIQIC
jgi:hypothetical protein